MSLDEMSGIFLIHDKEEGSLVEMTETEYDSEAVLQTLLAKYPNLLAGDQINSSDPREWLLVAREAGLPCEEAGTDRWAVDHLFLDQDGVPTLVEVKRSTDTRIRREVVGQMLDYAANAVVYWPAVEIRTKFEATCEAESVPADERLAGFLRGKYEPQEFWERVKTNLEAGRVRMVFVADQIPTELQRIVEFLNVQMNPAEVLALQIKQYASDGMRTLVPRVIGQTASAQEKKAVGSSVKKQWDEQSFFAEMASREGSGNVEVAKSILEWAKNRNLRIWWGKGGSNNAGFYPVFDCNGIGYPLVGVRTGFTAPYLEMQFGNLKNKPPYDDEEKRREFVRLISTIPGVNLPADAINKYPGLPLTVFYDQDVLKQLLGVFESVIQQIQQDELHSRRK